MEDLSKVLIFGIDGLQLSQVIPEKMPNLSKLKSRGTFWSQHHSVFPTVTRVNTVSMLTGCNPGTHGLAGNYVVLRDYDPSEVIPLLQPELEEVTAKIGPVLKVPNIVNIIGKYGLKFAAVNIGSTGNAYLHNYDKSPNGIVIHPEFCIPDTLEQDIQDRFGKWPAKTLYDEDRQEKAMEILLSYVLDELDPSVAMFWSNNPDTVQHASPVGGQMSDKALSIVDNQIGKLSRYIDANKNMNILFVSDHGYSTIKDTVNIADNIKKGSVVIAIPAPDTKDQPRTFFDKLNSWAKSEDQGGMGYVQFVNNEGKGPIANNLDKDRLKKFLEIDGMNGNSSIFFLCGKEDEIMEFAATARMKIANELKLIKENEFQFCWVIDYPMYQKNIETNKIEFSHNPFSMPQGGLEELEKKDPLDVKAYQYDIVCNGVELSSGAIRNHKPEIMVKAFEIAGYTKKDLEKQFSGLLQAFNYGAPPHGGCAPGIDRIVMLVAGEPNIREIIPFPFNQKAEDLMMNAPAEIDEERLKELSLKISDLKKKD